MSPSSRPETAHGAANRGDRPELITATGWRVVGSAAELLSDPLGVTIAATLEPEDILYAAQFLVRPRSGKGDAVGIVLSVLNGALSPLRKDGEPLARTGSVAESEGRFHGVLWDSFTLGDRWAGELTWIHRHPVIAGLPCTTHAAITERGRDVALTVHVGVAKGLVAVRGFAGAGQARPAFLAELNRVARLGFDGGDAEPRTLDDAEVDGFVRHVLLSETRGHPVAVLAPVEPKDHTEPTSYLVPPAEVAEELLGLAQLYVLARHPTTFRLSDALGDRRLSAYWGALRVYMPGFSCADSGMQHPLLVRDKVPDPLMRAGTLGQLGREARHRVPLPTPVAELREAARPRPKPAPPPVPAERAKKAEPASAAPAAAAEPPHAATAPAPDGQAAPQAAPGADGTGRLTAAVEQLISGLTAKLDELIRLNTDLIDEVSWLRTATVVRSANAGGVERRLGQFERLLREHLRASSGADEEPPEGTEDEDLAEEAEDEDEDSDLTLVSVVQHAESEYSDALLILDSAIASAAKSPFEDVQRIAQYLSAMADVSRSRQEGNLKRSLHDAMRLAGLDYRGGISQSTSKRHRRQYVATLPNGEIVECPEHIVVGTSYDPRHCLRIYFTSRAPAEPRFVIAHVGRHFEVMTTT